MKTGACIWENRCTHLTKQVHVFDKTGAPVLCSVGFSARLDLQSNRNEYKHF